MRCDGCSSVHYEVERNKPQKIETQKPNEQI